MNIIKKAARKVSSADFSWAQDSRFVPPKQKKILKHKTSDSSSNRAGDLKPLLDDLLATLSISTNASAAAVRIHPLNDQKLQLLSSFGLPEYEDSGGSPFDFPCESCEHTVFETVNSVRHIKKCGTASSCPYRNSTFQPLVLSLIKSRSLIKNKSPIENKNDSDTSLGTLTLIFKDPPPSLNEHTATVIQSFADLIGTVIERNKANFSAKRLDQMAERQAISNEIHDSLAQTLAYARMRSNLLKESVKTGNEVLSTRYTQDIDEALEISQKNARDLIKDFRCAIDPSGLLTALQNLTEQFGKRNTIKLEYINRVAHLELPLDYEIQLFHIVQEALTNIANHSEASHARLIVEYTDQYYIFTIKDNGTGGCTFTPVEGHYGMMIMQERAQRIGGELKVESTKGLGTLVQLYFPEPDADWRELNG